MHRAARRRDPAHVVAPDAPVRSAREALAIAIAAVVAVAVRLAPWRQVFAPDGVHILFDSDPHFHLFQAARLLARGFSPTWFDTALSWPAGAPVLWPPLWDLSIAGATRAVCGPNPTVAQLERIAAVLPVVVGAATIPVIAWLARQLLPRQASIVAAFVFALLGSDVVITVLGRPDQHGVEILLHGAVMACFARTLTARGGRLAAASSAGGMALALAFWNWQGSAVDLLIPGAVAALGHVVLRGEERAAASRALAATAAVATVLLSASVALWGPPGALGRGTLAGITGLHVAITAGAAAFGGLLLLAHRLAPRAAAPRRSAEVVAAAFAALAVGLGWSSEVRDGVRHGLTALGAASPWHETIAEFRPALFSCGSGLLADLKSLVETWGLTLIAAAWSVPALARRWRQGDRCAAVLLLAVWGGAFFPLAMLRQRFGAYLAIPATLLAADGLLFVTGWAAARAGRWGRLVLPVSVAATVAPCALLLAAPMPENPPESIQAARWMRTQPVRVGQEGVLAPWDMGHLVLYYARRPVVVSPFGCDLGPEPMAFASAFRLTTAPAAAEEMLLRRRVGYVVLSNPAFEVVLDQQLAPGAPVYAEYTCRAGERPTTALRPEFDDVTASRLFYFDGLTLERPAPPFTRLRHVYETPAIAGPAPPLGSVKVYQVVQGARLTVTGASPGRDVRADAVVATVAGREFSWSSVAVAGDDGVVRFRIPYSSGANGSGSARLTVSTERRSLPVHVAEEDVLEGRELRLRLDAS